MEHQPTAQLEGLLGSAESFHTKANLPPGSFPRVVLSLDGIEVSASNIAPRVLTELRPSSFPSLEALFTADACTYRPTLSVMLPVPASSSLKTLIALSLDHHNGSDARYIVSHLHPLRGLSNLNDFVDTPLPCSLDISECSCESIDVSVSLAIGWWLRTRPPLFNYRSALHLESNIPL